MTLPKPWELTRVPPEAPKLYADVHQHSCYPYT